MDEEATATAPETESQPWVELLEHLGADNVGGVRRFFDDLPHEECGRVLSRVDSDSWAKIVTFLEWDAMGQVVGSLPDVQAVEILGGLPAADAAAVLHELPEEKRAELLREMDDVAADAILAEFEEEESARLRENFEHPDGTAGALMTTRYLSYRQLMTVGDVLHDMASHAEDYAGMDVQYAYVINRFGRLEGVIQLRNLVMTPRHVLVRDMMIEKPLSVVDTAELDDLTKLFGDNRFLGVPVTDARGKLVGVLARSAVQDAAGKRDKESFLRSLGIIGGEELRSLPLRVRSLRRLAWLVPNIILNLLAASVIGLYTDTLEAVIVIAMFLPIVSDMSGCSGNQAVAVSMRELTLGILKKTEYLRVVAKEGLLGVINGLVLGTVLGGIAALICLHPKWNSSPLVGLVIGVALFINTVFSVLLGGLMPLILKRFGVDPALASTPILTTLTDMFGFFLVLSLTTVAMGYIT